MNDVGCTCLTIDDVIPVDLDVAVSVRAGLLVVEAQGVEQLVLDGAVVQTALTIQRHRLTSALTTHVRVAAAETHGQQVCSVTLTLLHMCLLVSELC